MGLATGDKCITGPQICPDQPGPTNCPAAFQVARRLLPKVHGPVTRAFHGWAQRRFKASSEATRRRLATPAECANGECYVAQVGVADPTAAPTALPTPMSAPFVIGAVTLFGITLDDAEASKAVLQNAVADVAGVEPDAVTITGVASARRRLQTGVVLDYVIQTAGNAEATDVSTALDAAADDPSLVDTAIAAAAAAAGAEEDLGDWRVDGVTDMRYMFFLASAFDQDLGWCVDNGVVLTGAFDNTPCTSTSCGVTQGSLPVSASSATYLGGRAASRSPPSLPRRGPTPV